jgi:adenylylsulfate kinase-like enzyme
LNTELKSAHPSCTDKPGGEPILVRPVGHVNRHEREQRNGHRGAVVWLTGLSGADLGFSTEDRAENIRRAAEVARLSAEAGMVVVTAFISPYRSDRLRARRIVSDRDEMVPFLEVYLDAALEVCERRDPKGLYARARAGRISEFTGVSAPYEPPEDADLVLHTGDQSIESCVERLRDRLLAHIRLPEHGG